MSAASKSILIITIGFAGNCWAAQKAMTEKMATPNTFAECIASGDVANCDSFPDSPKYKPQILGAVKSYNECVTSNLPIDCGSLPGAPKKPRRPTSTLLR